MNTTKITREQLAKMIDHTLLRPEATKSDIEKLCKEAIEYGFYSVVVNPSYVSLAVSLLKGTGIKVVSVIGFPFGSTLPEVKVFEANRVLELGANEIDMVINIGALKNRNYELIKREIEEVVKIAHKHNAIVKVIIETCYLTDEEKITACKIAEEAGADFVKTSTGFGTGGATIHDVELMRKTVSKHIGVKAAGGIHTAEQALSMIKAGATRIGASRSIEIINSLNNQK
ncbi:MAG: deoxyribose-phosphate aldolase [Thermoprotei archaeon]|jgi:deoxyribose-phosphate aldolase